MPVSLAKRNYLATRLMPVQNQPHFAGAAGEIMRRSISVVGLFIPHKIAAIKQAEINMRM